MDLGYEFLESGAQQAWQEGCLGEFCDPFFQGFRVTDDGALLAFQERLKVTSLSKGNIKPWNRLSDQFFYLGKQ